MKSVDIKTFQMVCQQAQIPRSQLTRLRQGQIKTLPLGSLQRLAVTFNLTLEQLVHIFDPDAVDPANAQNAAQGKPIQTVPQIEAMETRLARLQQEYERLQQQLMTQKERVREDVQRDAIQVLESLLLQLPTAAHAATHNPEAPAVRLLPLLKPIDQLLKHWNIQTIGTIGTIIAFDPQLHQWMPTGTNEPPGAGDAVRVRYVGYRQGDRLLYRAKVSGVEGHSNVATG